MAPGGRNRNRYSARLSSTATTPATAHLNGALHDRVESNASHAPVRNVRGKTRCLAAERAFKSAGSKLYVTLTPEDGRPTGPNSQHFVNEIGFVVRTFAPLKAQVWTDIPASEKELLIDRILTKFDVNITEKHVKRYLNMKMSSVYSNFRYRLKNHFQKFTSLEEARRNKPEEVVSQDDWEFICELFGTDKYKKRSIINTENRKRLPYNHRGGSKSFVKRLREGGMDVDEEKVEEPNGRISLYRHSHWKEGRGWINSEAESHYKKIIEKKREQLTLDASEQKSEAEICEEVLGKRSGFVKGLGFGPQPKTTRSSCQFSPPLEVDTEKEEMKAEISSMQLKLKQLSEFLQQIQGSELSFSFDPAT